MRRFLFTTVYIHNCQQERNFFQSYLSLFCLGRTISPSKLFQPVQPFPEEKPEEGYTTQWNLASADMYWELEEGMFAIECEGRGWGWGIFYSLFD